MNFNVGKFPYFTSVTPTYQVNPIPQKQSGQITNSLPSDKFESTSPKRFTSEIMLHKLGDNNAGVHRILKSVNIPYQLNIEELNNILEGHCTDTQNIAEGIVKNLPFSLESKADLNAIKNAAYLHDIGKVFIPTEILNKNGKLTEEETNIVHKHAELGYELLKDSGIDNKTLLLIRNHHQNAQKSGYPRVDNNFNADLDLQILSTADKYSALTETRPYKEPMNREQALTIIRADVRNRKTNPLIYNALVNYTDTKALENLDKTKTA